MNTKISYILQCHHIIQNPTNRPSNLADPSADALDTLLPVTNKTGPCMYSPPHKRRNPQVHRSTHTSPYSLILSCHPPGPSLIYAISSSTNTSTISSPLQMRGPVEARQATVRVKVYRHLRRKRASYKFKNDRLVRTTPLFHVGTFSFIDTLLGDSLKAVHERLGKQHV